MCSKHVGLDHSRCVSACAWLTFNVGQTLTSSPQGLPQQFHPSCFPFRQPSTTSYHYSPGLQMGGKKTDLCQILILQLQMGRGKNEPTIGVEKHPTFVWLNCMRSQGYCFGFGSMVKISFLSSQALQQNYRRQIFLFLTLSFFPS